MENPPNDIFCNITGAPLFTGSEQQLMKNQAAFWKYFRDFNFYNLIFSILNVIFFGLGTGLVVYISFGMGVGYLGYRYFKKDEYFLYYNLGFTKKDLVKKVWIYNLLIVGPVLLIFLLL